MRREITRLLQNQDNVDFLTNLLEIYAYLFGGDAQIFQSPLQSTTASGTGTITFQPSDAATELEVLCASLVETTAQIDAADTLTIYYTDLLSAFNFNLALQRNGNLPLDASSITWPEYSAGGNPLEINAALVRNLVLRTTQQGKPRTQLNFQFKATSTVGTRSWYATAMFVAKPRLNP